MGKQSLIKREAKASRKGGAGKAQTYVRERQAIEKIRKIVEGLGENSYVGFAMEGVLELAEDNIREDTACSMKKRAEIAWERADKAEKENKENVKASMRM